VRNQVIRGCGSELLRAVGIRSSRLDIINSSYIVLTVLPGPSCALSQGRSSWMFIKLLAIIDPQTCPVFSVKGHYPTWKTTRRF